MLKTFHEILTSTPYLCRWEPEELSFATVLGVLILPLALVHSAVDNALTIPLTQQALARDLPSSLLFAVSLCLLVGVTVRAVPRYANVRFVPFTARFVRQFCLAMLCVALPFFLKSLGFGIEIYLGGHFSADSNTLKFTNGDEFRFAFTYAGFGIAVYLMLMAYRGFKTVAVIECNSPKIDKRRAHIEALGIALSVSGTVMLTTYVVVTWELPPWMSVIKPNAMLGN